MLDFDTPGIETNDRGVIIDGFSHAVVSNALGFRSLDIASRVACAAHRELSDPSS